MSIFEQYSTTEVPVVRLPGKEVPSILALLNGADLEVFELGQKAGFNAEAQNPQASPIDLVDTHMVSDRPTTNYGTEQDLHRNPIYLLGFASALAVRTVQERQAN